VARSTLTRLAAAVLLAAAAWASLALADEAPTLFPGDVASVNGTGISCVTSGTDVRCAIGNLTATLTKAGKVSVLAGKPTSFAVHGNRMRLSLNGGFIAPGSAAYCHVYAAPARTMTCSLIRPKGGIPGTQGFDMASKTVLVYRYDAGHNRHDVAHYPTK
jgi:hypothetical protein